MLERVMPMPQVDVSRHRGIYRALPAWREAQRKGAADEADDETNRRRGRKRRREPKAAAGAWGACTGATSRRRDCNSAAPPSPFSRRFNICGEGMSAK